MNTHFKFKLFLIFIPSLFFTNSLSLKGHLLNCGSETPIQVNNQLTYNPDQTYLDLPNNNSVSRSISESSSSPLPLLSTLRSFPINANKTPLKFCYAIPTVRHARYLVRTTYYYFNDDDKPNSDLLHSPPVFDQIIDGTFWTVVNTTSDYSNGMASTYEAIFLAGGKFMSVCLAANSYTLSDPFINALELIILHDSVYNSTDFKSNAMGLIARSSFGYTGPIIGYPDDEFNRYWKPFLASGSQAVIRRRTDITTADGFWNLPPRNVLNYAIISDHPEDNSNINVELKWPPVLLQNSSYYIALYFADFNSSIEDGGRSAFNVFINDLSFCSNLKATASGVSVFSSQWILSGLTTITLSSLSSKSPIINAGEIFGIFPLGQITITKDVIALREVKKSIQIPPVDWSGDPCQPRGYSWSGVTCSEGSRIRVIALNLSGMGLTGTLSPYIANMTALTNISFANNNFSGHIPDLRKLRNLKTLHLQDNQLTGVIPRSLEKIKNLSELFLENNNMSGKVPLNLLRKPGLTLRLSPGNNFSER